MSCLSSVSRLFLLHVDADLSLCTSHSTRGNKVKKDRETVVPAAYAKIYPHVIPSHISTTQTAIILFIHQQPNDTMDPTTQSTNSTNYRRNHVSIHPSPPFSKQWIFSGKICMDNTPIFRCSAFSSLFHQTQ